MSDPLSGRDRYLEKLSKMTDAELIEKGEWYIKNMEGQLGTLGVEMFNRFKARVEKEKIG